MNILENELFIPYKLADRIDICQAWQRIVLSNSGRSFTSIIFALNRIKNSNCKKCQKQLTKDSCYVYFWKNKNIIKWTMENANKFNSEDFRILFCSLNCFQQSSWYKNQKQNTINHQQTEQSSTNSQPEPDLCSGHGCLKEIPPKSTYFYNPKNPQNKFCSQNCYQNYYGELCWKCKNTFLKENLYAPDENYPNYTLCEKCYQEYQNEEKENQEKNKNQPNPIIFNETSCEFCLAKLPNRRFFPVCDSDDCKRKFWDKGNNYEQNYTQNKIQQSLTESNYLNSINSLFSQILHQIQSTYGENSSFYQKLEKEQKETLNILEKASEEEKREYLGLIRELMNLMENNKSNELSFAEQQKINNLFQEADYFVERLKSKQVKIKQKKNIKLVWWVGGGLLGIGIVGLIIYLIIKKNRRKDKND